MFAAMMEEIARQHADDLLREAEAARLARLTKQPGDRVRGPRRVRKKPRPALAGR